MSDIEREQHAGQQREEQNTLLRSLLGLVRIIGGALALLLLTGIGIAVADHFKLMAVDVSVTALTISTEKAADDMRARNEANTAWKANVDAMMISQKAEILALANRASMLESELRQQERVTRK